MDVNTWTIIGAIAGVLALSAVVVAILAYRRQFPRRQLQYSVEAIPLLQGDISVRHQDLRVVMNGSEIATPYVLSVNVWSKSRADIPSAAFDNQDPISFSVSVPMFVTGTTMRPSDDIGFDWDGVNVSAGVREARVLPQLIRRRSRGQFTAVTEGKPEVTVADSLIDIKLKHVSKDEAFSAPTFWRTLAVWFAAGATVAAVSAMIENIVNR